MRANARDYVLDTVFLAIAIGLNAILVGNLVVAAIVAVLSAAFAIGLRRTFLQNVGKWALCFFVCIWAFVFLDLCVTYFTPGQEPHNLSQATVYDICTFPWSATAVVLLVTSIFLSRFAQSQPSLLTVTSIQTFLGGILGALLAVAASALGVGEIFMAPVAYARLDRAERLATVGVEAQVLCKEYPFDSIRACQSKKNPRRSRSNIDLSFTSLAMVCSGGGPRLTVSFNALDRVSATSVKTVGDSC